MKDFVAELIPSLVPAITQSVVSSLQDLGVVKANVPAQKEQCPGTVYICYLASPVRNSEYFFFNI